MSNCYAICVGIQSAKDCVMLKNVKTFLAEAEFVNTDSARKARRSIIGRIKMMGVSCSDRY